MKRLVFLGILAAVTGSASFAQKEDPPDANESILRNVGIKTDAESLLQFFRNRTLSDADRAAVRGLIRQLGAKSYRDREQATTELLARGSAVIELLKEAASSGDLEVARRAQKIMERIQNRDYALDVPVAAARLLAKHQPAGTVETLLTYAPFADNERVSEEIRATIVKAALPMGRLHAALPAALSDPNPARRALTAEVLVQLSWPAHRDAVGKLLGDPQPTVRLRVATALAYAKDREAIPALIDLLPHLTQAQAWHAEDLLYRLGEDRNPPAVSLGADEASRKKCRDAWAAWWKDHGEKIDLARLHDAPRLLGHTVVVLLDVGRVMELGPDNKVRWAVDNLAFPLDVQFLPAEKDSPDRILVTEYHASQISERTLQGEIVWRKRIGGPLAAQRLSNGNTFIVTDSELLEFDATDKEVLRVPAPNNERIMKAMKLPNGEICCLTSDAKVSRLDGAGKVVNSFSVNLAQRLFGGRIHMLPSGRVLVPHHVENKVVEYDTAGKEIWSVNVEQPVAALRLPNGHTLVTSMLPERGAVEFDRQGKEVWSFGANTRLTRALRR